MVYHCGEERKGMCRRCVSIWNPFKELSTFEDMLHSCDDQVFVRGLITNILTVEQKKLAVELYNEEMIQRHQRVVGGEEGVLQIADKEEIE